ncbi:queuosine precursor transporter [Methylobrevis pamukkalensis]|uniref:Probable queuosine precursor transporter n=1 Tax=Methylobrevis pamukkalensis TaxID=1439726 RepID=A0A1E3H0P3_9HYPH|nr:queuosine precursor transporter [Methylobrevis pamukkalensis]ODN69870.1 Inner membrane protein YhhQ [Methylobrevis pamukkalensis]
MTFGLDRRVLPSIAAMCVVVVASNILVQYPFEPFGMADILTWGAFTYPFAFLVTDLTNRWYGPRITRRVIYAGFAVAVLLSLWLSDPRIALASGAAFLSAQLLDVAVFNRLRQGSWWRAPLASSTIGSAFDTVVFFSLAFAGTGLPWTTWALGDFAVKMLVALAALVPYASLMNAVKPFRAQSAG